MLFPFAWELSCESFTGQDPSLCRRYLKSMDDSRPGKVQIKVDLSQIPEIPDNLSAQHSKFVTLPVWDGQIECEEAYEGG